MQTNYSFIVNKAYDMFFEGKNAKDIKEYVGERYKGDEAKEVMKQVKDKIQAKLQVN